MMTTVTRRPSANKSHKFIFTKVPLMFHFSLFFQLPVTESQHFLMPLFEAIDLKENNQYPRYDYNKVPHGTCFKQSVFAGTKLGKK